MQITTAAVKGLCKQLKLDLKENTPGEFYGFLAYRRNTKKPTLGRKLNTIDVFRGKETYDIEIKLILNKENGTYYDYYQILVQPEKAREYGLDIPYRGTTLEELKRDINIVFGNDVNGDVTKYLQQNLEKNFYDSFLAGYEYYGINPQDKEIFQQRKTKHILKRNIFNIGKKNLATNLGISKEQYKKELKEYLKLSKQEDIRTPSGLYDLQHYLIVNVIKPAKRIAYNPIVELKPRVNKNKTVDLIYHINGIYGQEVSEIKATDEESKFVAKYLENHLG